MNLLSPASSSHVQRYGYIELANFGPTIPSDNRAAIMQLPGAILLGAIRPAVI